MSPDKGPSFHVNEEVYIEPTAGSQGFHTHVVGFIAGRCIILDRPFKESGSHRLKANDSLWVRCFQSSVFRFRTRVLGIIEDPVPLFFVEFPRATEEINLRESERKKIFVRGTFLDLQDRKADRSWEGYILDISDTGCLMWGDFIHLVDRDILLSFRVPWSGQKIQTKARVVRCEVTDKGIRSGLQFLDLDSETEKALRGFIASLKDDRTVRAVAGPVCVAGGSQEDV